MSNSEISALNEWLATSREWCVAIDIHHALLRAEAAQTTLDIVVAHEEKLVKKVNEAREKYHRILNAEGGSK